ncbi:hypothetical protein RHGRI_000371 [Rhododendron griersonianum]|uniref:GH18 domain-containing protein n=1 Tax=Rhododendron griersonianum TaxID=479676 RepID=A0AAV6LGP5_9ERIC|nr:hypothetical protein RHGRI_000371 [Rhododendron griersonianum]
MLFTIVSFLLFLPSLTSSSEAQTWIKGGYWYSGGQSSVIDIDSTLFTHLTFAFAYINNSTYELWIEPYYEPSMSTFTDIVRQKNPSITTLLSIFVGDTDYSTYFSTFFSMASQSSHRTSFIESSIQRARLYGFHGLELCCVKPNTNTTKIENMGILFDDWRTAIDRESKNSTRSPLLLTLAGYYLPSKNTASYPMESIRRNFDWVHIVSYYYHLPTMENFTGAHSALYDPSSNISTDYGIKEWTSRGLPADKMVLGLAYHGYAWTLLDPSANEIGSPATGPAVMPKGLISYKFIKSSMGCDGEKVGYKSTYVTNYCINGSVWIGYDDVEAIRTKVSYAREKGLLGYNVWQVANDYNWVLSKAANQYVIPGLLEKPANTIKIPEDAYKFWKDGKSMEFMDPLMDDTNSACKLVRCMQVALLCVQDKWEDRPSMLEVYSMLKNEIEDLPTPKRHAFAARKDMDEENYLKSMEENCSVNYATMSWDMPR